MPSGVMTGSGDPGGQPRGTLNVIIFVSAAMVTVQSTLDLLVKKGDMYRASNELALYVNK